MRHNIIFAVMMIMSSIFADTSCTTTDTLMSADLAFVLSADGAFDRAISGATAVEGTRDYTHVAIVFESEGQMKIIEAAPGGGVAICTLDEFIERNGNVDFYRLSGVEYDADAVIDRAKAHLGEEYDYTYLPDNRMMYCSELVYESFMTEDGEHIFSSKPMNFLNSDGSLDEFWQNLFERLEMEVPQNVPGTNPNDMSKDTKLVLVKEVRR